MLRKLRPFWSCGVIDYLPNDHHSYHFVVVPDFWQVGSMEHSRVIQAPASTRGGAWSKVIAGSLSTATMECLRTTQGLLVELRSTGAALHLAHLFTPVAP